MCRPLIIGIGNPLRRDDGLGQRVAEIIGQAACDVDVIAAQQLTPELSETVSSASRVVFVDADVTALPGEVRLRHLEAPTNDQCPPLSHQVNPAVVLAIAERLFGRRPPAVLVSIGAGDLAFGNALTTEVTSVIPAALAKIATYLQIEVPMAPRNGARDSRNLLEAK